ncbi:MAG: hypothetical protein KJ709_08495 [Nanoarchaeota archaeon]|nr:hypothetical protein [Nanoarchaeota archaeon]
MDKRRLIVLLLFLIMLLVPMVSAEILKMTVGGQEWKEGQSISIPEGSATVRVDVEGNNGPYSCRTYILGQPDTDSMTVSCPVSQAMDFSALEPGTYSLQAIGWDKDNTRVTSTAFSFKVEAPADDGSNERHDSLKAEKSELENNYNTALESRLKKIDEELFRMDGLSESEIKKKVDEEAVRRYNEWGGSTGLDDKGESTWDKVKTQAKRPRNIGMILGVLVLGFGLIGLRRKADWLEKVQDRLRKTEDSVETELKDLESDTDFMNKMQALEEKKRELIEDKIPKLLTRIKKEGDIPDDMQKKRLARMESEKGTLWNELNLHLKKKGYKDLADIVGMLEKDSKGRDINVQEAFQTHFNGFEALGDFSFGGREKDAKKLIIRFISNLKEKNGWHDPARYLWETLFPISEIMTGTDLDDALEELKRCNRQVEALVVKTLDVKKDEAKMLNRIIKAKVENEEARKKLLKAVDSGNVHKLAHGDMNPIVKEVENIVGDDKEQRKEIEYLKKMLGYIPALDKELKGWKKVMEQEIKAIDEARGNG